MRVGHATRTNAIVVPRLPLSSDQPPHGLGDGNSGAVTAVWDDKQGGRPFSPDESDPIPQIDVGDTPKLGGVLGSLVLTAVERSGSWRVEFAWPKHTKRYFGNFGSQAEAEKWIEEHRQLIDRPQEPETDDYQ